MDNNVARNNSRSPDAVHGRSAHVAAEGNGQPGPTIGALLRRVGAHWHVALLVLTLGLGVTGIVVKNRKLSYRSETVIFYREGIQRAFIGEGGGDPLKQLGAKLKEMLLSQSTLKVVIDECHLSQ